MTDSLPVSCPYCGEVADLEFEDEGWSRQQFVQDCPVCCQPWNVELTRDRDGDWTASVRTGDE